MAKLCASCGKGSQMSGTRVLLRGHYNPTKKSRKYPNLQWAMLPAGGRIKICTSCLKKGRYPQIKINLRKQVVAGAKARVSRDLAIAKEWSKI